MKKTIWLLSTLLMLLLCTCSKDKELTDLTGVPDLKSAHSSGAVITGESKRESMIPRH